MTHTSQPKFLKLFQLMPIEEDRRDKVQARRPQKEQKEWLRSGD